MKDYYKILGVTPATSDEKLRKSYRKLAMLYHPDRNPDNPAAEEKFKEVAEAYGVLTDPVKRRAYDACRVSGKPFTNGQASGGGDGFTYSQEDILRDLFKDPRFQQMFSGILREFQRSGFPIQHAIRQKKFFRRQGRCLCRRYFSSRIFSQTFVDRCCPKKSDGQIVGTQISRQCRRVDAWHGQRQKCREFRRKRCSTPSPDTTILTQPTIPRSPIANCAMAKPSRYWSMEKRENRP